jgi:hypothetical protein
MTDFGRVPFAVNLVLCVAALKDGTKIVREDDGKSVCENRSVGKSSLLLSGGKPTHGWSQCSEDYPPSIRETG